MNISGRLRNRLFHAWITEIYPLDQRLARIYKHDG